MLLEVLQITEKIITAITNYDKYWLKISAYTFIL